MSSLRPKPTSSTAAAWPIGAERASSVAEVLSALASLRLTVVLFALSIFLVFAGTLAQVDHDVWDVVNHSYFRVWFAHIELQAFERLVQMFCPRSDWNLAGGFYFPGRQICSAWLLLVNLFAAHAVRFKVAASGTRLAVGLAIIAAGVVITALVIRSGMNDTLESELSPAFCNVLWQALRATLAGVGARRAPICSCSATAAAGRPEWWLLLAVDLPLVAAGRRGCFSIRRRGSTIPACGSCGSS